MDDNVTFLENFNSEPCVDNINKILKKIDPEHPGSDTYRKDKSIHTDLNFYLVQLGYYTRQCEFKSASLLNRLKETHKTTSAAESSLKLTKEYQHWKMGKTLSDNITNLIYSLKAETNDY